jgi:glucokinase
MGLTVVGDFGGTNTRLKMIGDGAAAFPPMNYPAADYPSMLHVAVQYLSEVGAHPDRAAFGIAGPTKNDDIKFPNNPAWGVFTKADALKEIGVERIDWLNDLEIVAWAAPHLVAAEYRQIGGKTPEKNDSMAILGIGTGVGVAAAIRNAQGGYDIVASEGGHQTQAGLTPRDFQILGEIQKQYGHVSQERVTRADGIIDIYNAIVRADRLNIPEIKPGPGQSFALDQAAMRGTDRVAVEALDLSCHFLGVAAGNSALAYGGPVDTVFLSGNVPAKRADYMEKNSPLRASFANKGRYGEVLANTPINVITDPNVGLKGLQKYVEMNR